MYDLVMIYGAFLGVVSGLGILWWSGDRIISLTQMLAHQYKISTAKIGFLVLTLAANIPELAVALVASLSGVSEVAVGDVLGSNVGHITLVLGMSMLVAPAHRFVRMNPYLLLNFFLIASTMFFIFSCEVLTWVHGCFLLGCYVLFFIFSTRRHFKQSHLLFQEAEHEKKKEFSRVMMHLCVQLILIFVASVWTVRAVTYLARHTMFGLHVLGATLVALGTSLPELALCVNALRRREHDFVFEPMLGNIFGHGTLILGVILLCSNKPINLAPMRETAYFMSAAFSIFGFSLLRRTFDRLTGFALVSLFLFYLVYTIVPSLS